jgi:tetratricopeptide (TPR) repeat protein
MIKLGTSTKPSVASPRPSASELLDSNIVFYEAVARRDPSGGMAPGTLALLYMRRARATGNYEDVLRAEDAARRSLANRGVHNTKAHQALVSSLLSEHRFTEALPVARELAERDPSNAAFRASLGEIQMELGQYDAARASFNAVAGQTKDLSVAPRLARWAELNGRPDEAYRLLNQSLLQILERKDVPAEQQAWFWLRIGDVQFRRGRFGDARDAYERGLAVHRDDYRLLAAMAKVEGAQRHWHRAIDFGSRAVAVALDPATLGTMSDAYAALGDSARANDYAHAMEVAVSRQATAYHRAWSLFLLDHGRRTDYVLAKSEEDLATRQDIYGYDVAAWALHKQGRDKEARAMMTRALALGTQDELLFYHAAVIDAALGRARESAGEMARARAIDPDLYVAGAR